jgi:hypothetical protein
MPGDRRVAAPRAGSRGVKHVLTADPLGRHPHQARDPAEGSRRAADDPCEAGEGC